MACMLVCRTWVPRARSALYRWISVTKDNKLQVQRTVSSQQIRLHLGSLPVIAVAAVLELQQGADSKAKQLLHFKQKFQQACNDADHCMHSESHDLPRHWI